MTRKELLEKAKPILFNVKMVKTILEGRKTVTRRAAFPADDFREFHTSLYPDGWWFRGRVYWDRPSADRYLLHTEKMCKYARGDILYVRETWWRDMNGKYRYLADYDNPDMVKKQLAFGHKAKPSIHMPKEATRILLRVTGIRVDRLRNMVLGDILLEGLHEADIYEETWNRWHQTWNSTIKPADLALYGWEANPWVWVIGFERVCSDERA